MRGNNTTDKDLDEHERLPCLGEVPEQPVLLHQQSEEELRRLGGLVDCQARIAGLGKNRLSRPGMTISCANRQRPVRIVPMNSSFRISSFLHPTLFNPHGATSPSGQESQRGR